MFEVAPTIHGMSGIEVQNDPKAAAFLNNAVLNNWMESEDYWAKQKVSPFVQGYDHRDGWILIEFWLGTPEDHQKYCQYLNNKYKK